MKLGRQSAATCSWLADLRSSRDLAGRLNSGSNNWSWQLSVSLACLEHMGRPFISLSFDAQHGQMHLSAQGKAEPSIKPNGPLVGAESVKERRLGAGRRVRRRSFCRSISAAPCGLHRTADLMRSNQEKTTRTWHYIYWLINQQIYDSSML
jgi:hypothetical protein